jgi:hypothetical protein
MQHECLNFIRSPRFTFTPTFNLGLKSRAVEVPCAINFVSGRQRRRAVAVALESSGAQLQRVVLEMLVKSRSPQG